MTDVSELNVVGGHLALDLVNTVEPRVPDRAIGREHLRSTEDLLAWSRRLGVVSREEAEQVETSWAASSEGDSALSAAREIREATYDVLLAALRRSERTAAAPLGILHRYWSAAAGRAVLSLTPDATTQDRLRVGTGPATVIPDRLAQAAVDLVRWLEVEHLKACPLEDGGCGWLFLDRSRNSSRRWCSMDDCGAKAKARRLTARRRRIRSSSARKV